MAVDFRNIKLALAESKSKNIKGLLIKSNKWNETHEEDENPQGCYETVYSIMSLYSDGENEDTRIEMYEVLFKKYPTYF